MQRFCRLVLCLAIVVLASPASAIAPRRSAHLLPAATKAYLSMLDSDALRDAWSRTRFAALWDADEMQAFRAQVQRRVDQETAEMERDYGVNLDELLALSTGESAMGAVETAGEKLTRVFLVETGDNPQGFQDLLRTAETRLRRQSAQRSEQVIAGVPVTVFTIPQGNAPAEEVLYFLHEGMLGMGGDTATVTDLLERWNEAAMDKLASLPAFQDTLQRVAAADPQWKPPVLFFVDPLRMDELLDPPEIQADGKRRPTLAAKHGFSAIQGIGGALAVSEDGVDVLYRMAVYAPPPHTKGMQMLDFPVGNDFALPEWAPDYLSSFTTAYWRLEKVIDNIGPVFDDVAANDDVGAFDDIYRDVKNDLGVDLKELFGRLGPQIAFTSDAQQEVSATSERNLISVAIKPGQEAKVVEELALLLKDDPTVKPIRLQIARREGNRLVPETHTLWRVGESGGLASRSERKGFSAAGVIAVRGRLFIATNYEMLRRLFSSETLLKEPRLAAAEDFQDAMQRLDALDATNVCARMFTRMDRDFFTTYELLRQDRVDEAENMYGRAITKLLEQFDKEQSFEFDDLPEFSKIADYFGVSASFVKPQPNGWLMVGFLKPK